MTNGRVFVNVTLVTGIVAQLAEPTTANFTRPLTRFPVNGPSVTFPVIVATIASSPVPILNVNAYFETFMLRHVVLPVPDRFEPSHPGHEADGTLIEIDSDP